MNHIHTNLAYLRAVFKLTQKEVAQATGISQKTLSTLETGASQGIEFSTLAKLCDFFKCHAGDILLVEEVPEDVAPSPESLKIADELVAIGMKRAMNSPKQSPEEIWAEFDAIRERILYSVQEKTNINRAYDKPRGYTRA